MPTLLNYTVSTSCIQAPTPPTRVFVQPFYDASGTGTLIWTKNGGQVPNDVETYFRLYEQGRRLDYPNEYTVTPGSGQSIIQVLFPAPGLYYNAEAMFVS